MQNTRNIVRLLVTDGDFILLAKVLKKGFYFLPGGGIEYNESLHMAAKRELLEELNVARSDVEIIEPIGIYEHSWDDNGSPFHEMNFVCKCVIKGFTSSRPVSSAESHLAFEWLPLDGLSKLDLRPQEFTKLIPLWSSKGSEVRFFASSMANG